MIGWRLILWGACGFSLICWADSHVVLSRPQAMTGVMLSLRMDCADRAASCVLSEKRGTKIMLSKRVPLSEAERVMKKYEKSVAKVRAQKERSPVLSLDLSWKNFSRQEAFGEADAKSLTATMALEAELKALLLSK